MLDNTFIISFITGCYLARLMKHIYYALPTAHLVSTWYTWHKHRRRQLAQSKRERETWAESFTQQNDQIQAEPQYFVGIYQVCSRCRTPTETLLILSKTTVFLKLCRCKSWLILRDWKSPWCLSFHAGRVRIFCSNAGGICMYLLVIVFDWQLAHLTKHSHWRGTEQLSSAGTHAAASCASLTDRWLRAHNS